MSTYHLFISHSWNYSDAYDRLVNLLDLHPTFAFKNFSVPPDDPITDAPTDEALERAIVKQIAPCSVVLIMAGMYANYSKWINKEIEIAQRFGKPIIAIKPFGAERISQVVRDASHAECAWSTNSIVNAIRLHGGALKHA